MANTMKLTMSGIFKSKVHGPSFNDKALYVQKASYNSDQTSDRELADSLKNAEYMKLSNTHLNSPTNVRRIFITHSKVIVEYYSAPLIKGKRDTLVSVRPLKDFDSWVKKWIDSKLLSPSQAAFSSSNRDTVKITGNLSQAVEYYKCSNVEEIYFDWSALVSDDLSGFINTAFNTKGEYADIHPFIIQNYMNKNGLTGTMSRNEAKLVFLGTKQDLTYKYSRLRAIGFISNLDDIDIRASIERFNSNNGEVSGKLWVENEAVLNYIRSSHTDFWLTRFNAPKFGYDSIDKFEIKKNQFIFDDKYLEPKLQSYINKYNDLKLANGYTAQKEKNAQQIADIDNTSVEAGSLDELILNIKKSESEKLVRQVLRLAARSIDSRVYNAEVAQMNPDIAKYVRSLVEK